MSSTHKNIFQTNIILYVKDNIYKVCKNINYSFGPDKIGYILKRDFVLHLLSCTLFCFFFRKLIKSNACVMRL